MKKTILSSILILSTVNAHAWSVSIGGWTAKGDDPQVVKDVVEGVKHGATQASNGVRDAFAVVGNATGITNVIDSNIETLSHLGRAAACHATLCYSEVLRKKQLDEVEAKLKQEYATAKAQYEESSRKDNYNKRVKDAKKALELADTRYRTGYEKYQLMMTESNIIFEFQKILHVEHKYRLKLQASGVQGRPLQYRDMVAPTEAFVQNRKTDYSQAMRKLNEDMTAISAATKRSRDALMAEFIRVIEYQTMVDIMNDTNEVRRRISEEMRVLAIELQELHAELGAAQNAYDSEIG